MTEESVQLPACTWGLNKNCTRPAVETVRHFPSDTEYAACRPCRREIFRENAHYIGHCEINELPQFMRAEQCENFPATMRTVNGQFIAVCLSHNSHVNRAYAHRRAKAS